MPRSQRRPRTRCCRSRRLDASSTGSVSSTRLGCSDVSDLANILLVDDKPENLVALEAILEPLGENLIRASSGEDALRQLLLHDVAVILLDVQMPDLDGFETAALIKQREKTRSIPIIFLTAIS